MENHHKPALAASLLLCWSAITGSAVAAVSEEHVQAGLAAAGANRAVLEQVIAHFAAAGDPEKLEAARFLIASMEGHSYVQTKLFDEKGARVEFDVLSYPSYEKARLALEAMEAEHGKLDFKRDVVVQDLEVITRDYLIENIDLAFAAWRSNPWAKGLTFAAFCEHVLPYRGSNEPIEKWRAECMAAVAEVADSIEDQSDPKSAASVISQIANRWVRFDELYYLHPTDLGYTQMRAKGKGRCEDITNMMSYVLRAAAIASAADYTPAWANHGNNHAWSVILDAEGRGSAGLFHRAAKVYRKTYSHQRDNLVFIAGKDESLPRWLASKNYCDVTDSYMETSDVAIEITRAAPAGGARFVYLAVWNDGEWRPIHWAAIDKRTVFSKMGRNILYLPVFHGADGVTPAADPFILDAEGKTDPVLTSTRVVAGDGADLRHCALAIESNRIAKDARYELLIWRDGWEAIGAVPGERGAPGEGATIDLGEVPDGGLFWLRQQDGRKEERVFIVRDKKVVWW